MSEHAMKAANGRIELRRSGTRGLGEGAEFRCAAPRGDKVRRMVRPAIASLVVLASVAAASPAQGGGREFPTPDASKWKLPPLLEWQRTVDDAIAVAKAQGRPLLVAVNMDGEAASEIFAAEKYRSPEFAKLAAPAGAVIVSVNRHNPRDYDDAGHRILCPRFGRVTCGEHEATEPLAFEKWFKGERVAPRHIGIGPDGKALFDRFLDRDLSVVDAALRDGFGPFAAKPAPPPVPLEEVQKLLAAIRDGDEAAPKDLEPIVASRDARQRAIVEQAFAKSDAAAKQQLLESAMRATSSEPYDLIRLGLHEKDPALRSLACKALIATATPNAVPLLAETLRSTKEAADRMLPGAALSRLGTSDARARMAAQVEKALRTPSERVDVDAWKAALKAKPAGGDGAAASDDPDVIEQRLNELTKKAAASPTDGKSRLELARETLRFAALQRRSGKNPTYLLEDAKRAATEAEKLGTEPAVAKAARASATFWLGDLNEAGKTARDAAPGLVGEARSPLAAETLRIVGRASTKTILDAIEAQRDWPAALLTDGHAAFTVLELHPAATADDAATHCDLLLAVGANDVAGQVLDAAIRRFPDSEALHTRFRAQVLRDAGIEGLESAYAALVKSSPAPAFEWFAGYASLVAAGQGKRAAMDEAALASYGRAVERFDKSAAANADYRETASHYVALALAGRARIELEMGNVEAAAADLGAAIARKPEIVDVEDGLQRAPRSTLGFLRARLASKPELRARFEEALAKVAPDLAEK